MTITEPTGNSGSGGGVGAGETSVLALDEADPWDNSRLPGLILRERSSMTVSIISTNGALLSERLTLVSPPSLVPGVGGVIRGRPALLGEANWDDGKKDKGLPESMVPWRLLADTDLETVILLTSSEVGVNILPKSGSTPSKALTDELAGNSNSGSVRVGPESKAPFIHVLGDVDVGGVPKLAWAAGGDRRLAPTPPPAGLGGAGSLLSDVRIGEGRADLAADLVDGDLERRSPSVSSLTCSWVPVRCLLLRSLPRPT